MHFKHALDSDMLWHDTYLHLGITVLYLIRKSCGPLLKLSQFFMISVSYLS